MKSDSRITCMNCVSILFLILTLLVCLVSVAWLTDTVAVPDSISPKTEVPFPTLRGLPTLAQPTEAPTVSPETTDSAPESEGESPDETPIATP